MLNVSRDCRSKGFTIVELLVVIGILGVLVAALVAVIQPFEQIKKTNDTKAQKMAVDLHASLLRYQASYDTLPWEGSTPACSGIGISSGNVDAGVFVESLESCLQVLIDDNELPVDFLSTPGTDQLVISEPYVISKSPMEMAKDGQIAVCYLPKSQSRKMDAGTKYASDGSVDPTCPDDSAEASCYWCMK